MKTKLTMLVVATITLVTLSGCVSSRETYTSTGTQGYKITCNGHTNSWDDCLAKAGDLCKERGYQVLEMNGENLPFAYSSMNATSETKARLFSYEEHNTYNGMAAAGIKVHRSVSVSCGVPAHQ